MVFSFARSAVRMRSRLLDLALSINGKQRLTIELDGDFREQFEKFKGTDTDFSIKKFRYKRSLDANAYAWVLIGKIAEAKHITKTEVYRNAIREIGGVSDVISIKKAAVPRLQEEWNRKGIGWQIDDIGSKIPGWTNVILYYGSSSYDTSQMADLIDSLIQDAKALGIETRTPEEINSLLEEYDKC